MKDTLNFVGTGTAPLTITANGNNASTTISGYPIKFSGGPVTIESKGAINHSVFVGYQGATSNTLGVDFAGTGPVSIDTKGVGGAGGQITLRGDKINLDAPAFTFNANGPDSGNGDSGTIDIAGFNNVTLTGAGLSVNAKGNGDGGTINIHDVATNLSVSGIIRAKGAGSGRGGNISLGANVNTTIDALGSAIKVSAGTAEVGTETGGLISLRNLSEDINLSGVFEARGGTNGNAGEIQVSAAKDIKLASGTQLLAKGYDAGNGGNIALQAGALANVTSAMIFYASSDIQIDASSAAGSGKAGTVNITYADDSGGSVMNILGPVIADGATQGGVISFSNKSPILGLTVNTQVVSALKGTINFPASPLSFGFSHVTGIAPSGVPGPYFGNVSMSGTFLSLKALGSAELNLGDFEATDDIEIETDAGDVKSDEGTELISTSGTIKFKSQTGKVGIGYLSPVTIKAPYVNVDFGSVPSAGTAIFLNSLRDVTVETFEASDGIFINSTNNIVFAENVRTTNGLIEVESGAQITLNSGKTISAAEGSISLRGTTKIELESNSSLLATTSTSDELLGNVFVSLLTINTGLTSPTPANVVINGNVTDTFFGFEGITADAPDNVLTAQNGRIIGLDTTILPSTQIHLGGNVTITAQGN